MIRIPEKLVPYVYFEEKTIVARNLPNELEKEFKNLKRIFDLTMNENDFAEY